MHRTDLDCGYPKIFHVSADAAHPYFEIEKRVLAFTDNEVSYVA